MSYIISITVHIHGYWNVWVQFHLHITTITLLHNSRLQTVKVFKYSMLILLWADNVD